MLLVRVVLTYGARKLQKMLKFSLHNKRCISEETLVEKSVNIAGALRVKTLHMRSTDYSLTLTRQNKTTTPQLQNQKQSPYGKHAQIKCELSNYSIGPHHRHPKVFLFYFLGSVY